MTKLISKKDLKLQRMMQMLIDVHELGDEMAKAIKQADYRNVEKFRMPTPRMETSLKVWETFWSEKK